MVVWPCSLFLPLHVVLPLSFLPKRQTPANSQHCRDHPNIVKKQLIPPLGFFVPWLKLGHLASLQISNMEVGQNSAYNNESFAKFRDRTGLLVLFTQLECTMLTLLKLMLVQRQVLIWYHIVEYTDIPIVTADNSTFRTAYGFISIFAQW